jgi:hypothetical protein
MSNLKVIIDATTNEVVEREMTKAELDAEKAERLERETAETALLNEAAAKESAKADLLTKLGITADEAKLLLS